MHKIDYERARAVYSLLKMHKENGSCCSDYVDSEKALVEKAFVKANQIKENPYLSNALKYNKLSGRELCIECEVCDEGLCMLCEKYDLASAREHTQDHLHNCVFKQLYAKIIEHYYVCENISNSVKAFFKNPDRTPSERMTCMFNDQKLLLIDNKTFKELIDNPYKKYDCSICMYCI